MESKKKKRPDGGAEDHDSFRSAPSQVLPFDLPSTGHDDLDPSPKLPSLWRSLVSGIVGKNKKKNSCPKNGPDTDRPWSFPTDSTEKKIAGKKWASAIKDIIFGRSSKTKSKKEEDPSASVGKESSTSSTATVTVESSSTTTYLTADEFMSSPTSHKLGTRSWHSSSASTPIIARGEKEASRDASLIIARSMAKLSSSQGRDYFRDRMERFPLLQQSSFRSATATPRSTPLASPASSASSRRSQRISSSPGHQTNYHRRKRSSSAPRSRQLSPSPSKPLNDQPATKSSRTFGNVAIAKQSEDPLRDFQDSMAEMIKAKNIRNDRELVNLLNCYLSLNAPKLHSVIIDAFAKVCQPL